MDSRTIYGNTSYLQSDDLRGHIFVEQLYRGPDGHWFPSVVNTSGVMRFVYPRGTSESIHPPLVLRGNLRLCWEPRTPLVHSWTEKMGEPTDLLVRYHQGRQRF